RAAEPETHFGRRQRDFDTTLELFHEAIELLNAFARDDHVGHAVGAVGLRHRYTGQPVTVSRRGPHLVVDHVEEDAHQIIARFLGRDGETRLLDDLAEGRRRQLEASGKLTLGDYGE